VLRSIAMRYRTLVADHDGTLAANDRISEETATALERVRASGRRAIMVTGRRLNGAPPQTRNLICELIHARYTLPE
jgi:hydroxymethylpyrimidine pyrophosphatase-like HAD family hydrolase